MLNVLPLEYKTNLKQRLLYIRIRNFGIFFVIISISLSLLLLTTEWMLIRWQETTPVNDALALISAGEQQELGDLVTNLQETSTAVQKINAQFHNPLSDVATVLAETPQTIHLHSFQIDYTTGVIRLTGTADDRESIIAYQQQLSKHPAFSKLIFPLGNLEIKENIPFSVEAQYSYDEVETKN